MSYGTPQQRGYHQAMKNRQIKPADDTPTFFSTEFDRGVVGGAGDPGLDSTGGHDLMDPTRHHAMPAYAHHLHAPMMGHHPPPPPPQHHQPHPQMHHPQQQQQHQPQPPQQQQQHQQQQPPQQQIQQPQQSPMAAPAPNPKRKRAPKTQAAAPVVQQGAVPANNGQPVAGQTAPAQPAKRSRTNTAWTQAEEQLLKQMRDQGASWSDIAKSFPTRTEGSVKKHWYKDMHWAEFGEEESAMLLAAIKEYDANKWKVIGAKVNKPAKACEAYAKEHFAGKI